MGTQGASFLGLPLAPLIYQFTNYILCTCMLYINTIIHIMGKKFIVILYKDVTMTIHISMQPAFFPFLTWLSGDIWSMILRLAELWAPSSSYAELLFFRSSWAFFSAGMHFEIVGEDRHGRTGRSRHSMVIVMVSHGEAKWSQSPLLKSEHPSSLKEVSKRCSATKEQSLNCVVTAKVSTCLNTDSKHNVKPGDSTKTCLNSSKFYMKSMNNFNELHPLLHHSRECTKLLPAFLHQ